MLFLGVREPGHRIHLRGSEVPVVLEFPEVVIREQVILQRGAAVAFYLVADGLVPEQGVFVGGKAALYVGCAREAEVSGETHLGASLLAAAGGDNYNAVCRADTVHCR